MCLQHVRLLYASAPTHKYATEIQILTFRKAHVWSHPPYSLNLASFDPLMEGIIISLFTKGDKSDVNNYREITLTTLFTVVIDNLYFW